MLDVYKRQVLKDDKLLQYFNIPKLLWPRLRLSWQNRRYQTITGRLDFCMDSRGLKVYEYNACLLYTSRCV